MNWKKGFVLACSAIVMTALIAGCGNSSTGSSDKAKKVLKVAGETTYPPFEFSDNGKYVGFDVDLSNALAKEMGREVEYVSMGFDALVPALQSKQVDAIVSGMVITKERQEKINFSEPYYQVSLVMVVKKDTTNVNSEADIAGKRVGAQIGTTGAFLAEKKEGTLVKQFDTIPNMLQDLENNNVDIAMLDEPIAKYYIQVSGLKDLKIVPLALQKHDLGIGVNKDDTELLKQFNDALKKIKENGEYAKLEKKWFGNIN